MKRIPKLFKKLQFLEDIEIHWVNVLGKRHRVGRIGYGKSELFVYLILQQLSGCSDRDLEEVSGINHSTFVKARKRFFEQGIYEKFFVHLVRLGIGEGVIKAEKIAMDSSFVETYSKAKEKGSAFWKKYEKKKGYGFKLHALIDATSSLPLALIITSGSANDMPIAIPLLKKFHQYTIKTTYVLADKGYDSADIVWYIFHEMKAKAAIPIRKMKTKYHNQKAAYQDFLLKAKGRCIKHSIYKRRSVIERFFATLKTLYNLGKNKTRGIQAFTRNAYAASIAFFLSELYSYGITSF